MHGFYLRFSGDDKENTRACISPVGVSVVVGTEEAQKKRRNLGRPSKLCEEGGGVYWVLSLYKSRDKWSYCYDVPPTMCGFRMRTPLRHETGDFCSRQWQTCYLAIIDYVSVGGVFDFWVQSISTLSLKKALHPLPKKVQFSSLHDDG